MISETLLLCLGELQKALYLYSGFLPIIICTCIYFIHIYFLYYLVDSLKRLLLLSSPNRNL